MTYSNMGQKFLPSFGGRNIHSQNCRPPHMRKKLNKFKWDAVYQIPNLPGIVSHVLVLSVAVLCYINSLDGQFVFDDSEAIINNKDVLPDIPVWNLLYDDFWGTRLSLDSSHKSYRPLTVLSFRWNYWLSGGYKPWSFHLTNIVLHAFVCVLSLPVFNILFGNCCPRASLLSALLFAVHPVHSEAVAGVVGRAELLCAAFFFLSFLMFYKSTNVKSSALQVLSLIFSIILCAISMLCKEQGITVLGICSVYDFVENVKLYPGSLIHAIGATKLTVQNGKKEETPELVKDSRESARFLKTNSSFIFRQATLMLSGASLLIFRWRMMGSEPPEFQKVDNPASFSDSFITRVLNYNYIYAINAWLLLCPEWLCFDWSMGCIPLLSAQLPLDVRIFAVLSFWIIFGTLVLKCLASRNDKFVRKFFISLTLIIVPFLPASNLFFRVGFVVAERVLYIPSAGFCMLIVLGMHHVFVVYKEKYKMIQAGFLSLLIIFAARSIQRSGEWKSEITLFRSGLDVCPLNAKVHYNIAKNAADLGNKFYAVGEYREALRLNPEYDQAMNNLANILKDEGKFEEAEMLLRRAVAIRHDFAAAWMNLGIVLAGLKRFAEAEDSYVTALKHRKKYPDCYYNLGNLFLEQKQYTKAYEAWRNATYLKPSHKVAWNNMIIMFDNLGEFSKAERLALEAMKTLPSEPSLHFNLANTLGKSGRFVEAEKHFLSAISLDTRNAVYYTNLGVLYHRWKKYEKAEYFYKQALNLNPHLKSANDNLKLLYSTKRVK